MTTHHFGTKVDGLFYLEQEDTSYVDPDGLGRKLMVRPAAGAVTVKVRDQQNPSPELPSVTNDDYGYVAITTEDIPVIEVSIDNWTTPITLFSKESRIQASLNATDGAAALVIAQALQDSLGAPDGIATLDANGYILAAQAAGLAPLIQNLDLTYPNRPDVPWPVVVARRVAGSPAPAVEVTAGDGGYRNNFDWLVDLKSDLAG
jgi:hypothetical protein